MPPRFSALGGPPRIVDEPDLRELRGRPRGAIGDIPLPQELVDEGQRVASGADYRGLTDPEIDDPGDIVGSYYYDLSQYRRMTPSVGDIVGDFGDYPDLDEMIGDLLSVSKAAQARLDPEAWAAAQEGLATLNQMAEEGFLPEEREKMRLMAERQDVELRGGEMAAMEQSARRGIGGSDLDRVTALASAQAQAQQGALRDVENAAAAAERKRWAATQAGMLGGDLAQTKFDEDFRTGAAADVMAQKTAEITTDWESKKADWTQERRQFAIQQALDQYGLEADAAARYVDAYLFGRGFNVAGQEGTARIAMNEPHYESSALTGVKTIAKIVDPAVKGYLAGTSNVDRISADQAAKDRIVDTLPEVPDYDLSVNIGREV